MAYSFIRSSHSDRIVFSEGPSNDGSHTSLPPELFRPSILTPESNAEIGYTPLDVRPRYIETGGLEDFSHQYIDEERLQSLGVVEELMDIRSHLADSNEPSIIELCNPSSNPKFPPHILHRVARITTTVFNSCLPESLAQLLRRRYMADASMCVGWEDNIYTSNVQVQRGVLPCEIRTDPTDDPCRYSVIIFLSSLPPSHFPGRFCLPTTREYCIAAPFTALVFRRTFPHTSISPREYTPDAVRHLTPQWATAYQSTFNLSVVSYPALDRMRYSAERYISYRAAQTLPILFGSLRNYSEWLLRLMAIEAFARAQGVFGISVDINHLAQTLKFMEGEKEVIPRITIVAPSNDSFQTWKKLQSRITSICPPYHKNIPVDVTVQEPHRSSKSVSGRPLTSLQITDTSHNSVLATTENPDVIVSNFDTQTSSTPGNAPTQPPSHPDRNSQVSKPLMTSTTANSPATSTPASHHEPSPSRVNEPSLRTTGRNSQSSVDPTSFTAEIGPIDPQSPLNPLAAPTSAPIQPSASQLDSTSFGSIPHPPDIPSDIVPLPQTSFTFSLPEWTPAQGLTQLLHQQIHDLFSLDSLRLSMQKYDSYQKLNLKSSEMDSPLSAQLELHLDVLRNGSSPLHGYEHLVSRASICNIVQKAPELRKDISQDILASDMAQRLSMSIFSSPGQDEDAFWKDFTDRNLLLCQIVSSVGSIILLAPGLYKLVLSAGGKSVAGKSAVRSTLQPALRSKIVETCIWHSQKFPDFMEELHNFWYRLFGFHPFNPQPSSKKLKQIIPPFVPTPGPCFRNSFPVLHHVIEHSRAYLVTADDAPSDPIWGRPHETDRLSPVREAGDCMRSLYNAGLHRKKSRTDPEIVFRNVLAIRTLFFGNVGKMREWKLFTDASDVETLVSKTSIFESSYGQSRVYGQYQFPTEFPDFSARLKTCWRATWPIPLTGSVVSWSDVHAAASNADGAGTMLRSLIASDMSRLAWCEGPEAKDWPQLISPLSASALNQLFPSAPRTFGPSTKKHVDPMLGEVVTVSLFAGLKKDVRDAIGFDRIFVEHLLSRFTAYQKEGWILENGLTRTKKRKKVP